MSEKNIDKKQNNSKLIIVAVCVGIVIIALLVIIMLLMSDKENQESISKESNISLSEDSKPKREVIVKEENVDQLVSELLKEEEEKDTVIPGYYQVTMNSTWEFENGSAISGNAYVKNSESNTNAVYFDIIKSDTNETIYQSPILTVGTDISQIKLDTELPAGTYDCVCLYRLLNDEYEPVSDVRVAVKIKIKN
ncbi:MAG: hypothetical protein J6A58_12265 [Oscillospiraceae bacterium]|nr:hypothetical protein [Oscillospiraceae bacterium]